MASGSDAAKNVAHLVSLDSSFSSLPDVVKEGRRVINNLQRSVSNFLVKTAFAVVLTALFLLPIFKTTNGYPFRLKNMLIWEVLTIGIGSLFLSLQPNDEKVKSKFLVNIVFRLIPAATVQILMVLFFFIFSKDYETAKTLSVLAFSIFSFVIFIRVCLPFDIFRTLLVIGLLFIGFVLLFADILAKGVSIFDIDYTVLTGARIFALITVLFIGVIIYIALSFGVSIIHKYLDKQREVRRKHDHF
jgi:cation-transporting ATPase E